MKDKKNLKLEEIKVESFVTRLDNDEQKAVQGGMCEAQGTTYVRVFC